MIVKKNLRTQISLTANKSKARHGVKACNLGTREVEGGGSLELTGKSTEFNGESYVPFLSEKLCINK